MDDDKNIEEDTIPAQFDSKKPFPIKDFPVNSRPLFYLCGSI